MAKRTDVAKIVADLPLGRLVDVELWRCRRARRRKLAMDNLALGVLLRLSRVRPAREIIGELPRELKTDPELAAKETAWLIIKVMRMGIWRCVEGGWGGVVVMLICWGLLLRRGWVLRARFDPIALCRLSSGDRTSRAS